MYWDALRCRDDWCVLKFMVNPIRFIGSAWNCLLYSFLFPAFSSRLLLNCLHFGSISNESFFIWIVFRCETSTNNTSINRRWHCSICLYGDASKNSCFPPNHQWLSNQTQWFIVECYRSKSHAASILNCFIAFFYELIGFSDAISNIFFYLSVCIGAFELNGALSATFSTILFQQQFVSF